MSRFGGVHSQMILGIALFAAVATARATEPLADPTQPPATAVAAVDPVSAKEEKDLDLRAIFHAGDRRIAVINGRRVGVGDRVGGARVFAIEVDRVRLERAGDIVELELVSPVFKDARRAEAAEGAPR